MPDLVLPDLVAFFRAIFRGIGRGPAAFSEYVGPGAYSANYAADAKIYDAANAGRFPRVAVDWAMGVGVHETGNGRHWGDSDPIAECHNAGAVQCSPVDGSTCVARFDSNPDGSRYPVGFRCKSTDLAGFSDVIEQTLTIRPRTVSALTEPGATIYRASFAMRREKYYAGFCPGVPSADANASLREPDKNEHTRACQEAAVRGHVKAMRAALSQVVAARGDKRFPLPVGDFRDAETWYRKRWLTS